MFKNPFKKYQAEAEKNPWILSNLPETFVAKILNPEKVIYIGKVKALLSKNRFGQFSILAGHANFITIVYDQLVLYPPQGEPQEIEVQMGMLRYLNNTADIYLGINVSEQLLDLPGAGDIGLSKELEAISDLVGEEVKNKVRAKKENGVGKEPMAK